jgi:hypothetical protein
MKGQLLVVASGKKIKGEENGAQAFSPTNPLPLALHAVDKKKRGAVSMSSVKN